LTFGFKVKVNSGALGLPLQQLITCFSLYMMYSTPMNNMISSERDLIRKQIRTLRRSLTEQQQRQASEKLLAQLIAHPRVQQAKCVSVTLPYDGEIDLTSFIHWCWEQNKHVYLPVVDPNQQGKLHFYHYLPNSPMRINRYGIREPDTTSTQNHHEPPHPLEIIFTPLVAFDPKGNRIGMGGGYYDRLLAPWFSQQTGPYPIGLAHDCQYVDHVPVEHWDVPLPEIITPAQHFCF